MSKRIEVAIETTTTDVEKVLREHGISDYTLQDSGEATCALVTVEQEAALIDDERVTYLSEL